MKKPINILYELIIYNLIWHGYIYAYRYTLASKAALKDIELYIIFGVFIACIISITMRTFFKAQVERRFISVFSFGFVIGCILWAEYSIVEFKGLDMIVSFKNIFGVIFGVLLFGAVAGSVGTLFSYFLEIILRKMNADG